MESQSIHEIKITVWVFGLLFISIERRISPAVNGRLRKQVSDGPVNADMITNFDEPFHVKAKIDTQLLELLITPVYNKIDTEAAFTVTFDGRLMGKLKRHNIKSWKWVDSKMEQDAANEIGLKIDAHYS